MPKHAESGAVDYRRRAFFKILYDETDEPEVSMTRGKLVMATFAVMVVGCAASAAASATIEQLLDNLKGVLLELVVFMFAYNELTSREGMQQLVKYIDRCASSPRYNLKEEEEKIMARGKENAADSIRFYTILFAVNFPMMMITKPIEQAWNGRSWKQLPFPWILPSDDDLVYYASLLLQFFGVGFSHCLGIVYWTSITGQITALFDVVIMGIERIEERAAQKVEKLGLTWEQSMYACISESIAHHQEILRVWRKEKPHMEFMFLSSVLFMSLVMACEAFPLILDTLTLFTAAKGLVFLVVQILCVYVSNNCMETMGDRNAMISHALYNSNWLNQSVRYRKVVLNGMTFCREPLLVSAGPFKGLKASRESFYNAITSSFNILSMMRRMM